MFSPTLIDKNIKDYLNEAFTKDLPGNSNKSNKTTEVTITIYKGGKRGSVVRALDLNADNPGSNPVLTTGWICLR